jgi:hypothetical protein
MPYTITEASMIITKTFLYNKWFYKFIQFSIATFVMVPLAACFTAPLSSSETSDLLGEPQQINADTATVNLATQQAPYPILKAELLTQRSPEVPELPFPDNPDPSQCGIPIQWGAEEPAWLSGIYDGELV